MPAARAVDSPRPLAAPPWPPAPLAPPRGGAPADETQGCSLPTGTTPTLITSLSSYVIPSLLLVAHPLDVLSERERFLAIP